MLETNKRAREFLECWKKKISDNPFDKDDDLRHSIHFYLPERYEIISPELSTFALKVITELEPLVIENNLPMNLPRIEHYDGIGNKTETIIHHPNYEAAGNIIYSSRLLERMSKAGGLTEALAFMLISSFAGEAGHNCPIACSAGIIRVLQKISDFPCKAKFLAKLQEPLYSTNFTGAQFLTEIQGGSDVGQNVVEATCNDAGNWEISGEKWFCSNADAELILITARYDASIEGTKGLGLFLIPSKLPSGERNSYFFRRLKDKIGTRSMASAEIDFNKAYAIPIGNPEEGFKLVMSNVLHISRFFNTFCVLGMVKRAYQIAYSYAQERHAFGHAIIDFPLVQQHLAKIKAENIALLSGAFAAVKLQDAFDLGKIQGEENLLLLRLLANLNKYLSALWSVEHIHHCLDILAGNGAIESFSVIPRLLRDSIVCENWEGTHNVLRMQIFRDILRYRIDEIFITYLQNELTKIDARNLLFDPLEQAIGKLEEELKKFKAMEQTLQELSIKPIVDLMAVSFAALHLLRESIDQRKNGNTSKTDALAYFIDLHLKNYKPLPTKEELSLIRHLVS